MSILQVGPIEKSGKMLRHASAFNMFEVTQPISMEEGRSVMGNVQNVYIGIPCSYNNLFFDQKKKKKKKDHNIAVKRSIMLFIE